MRIDLVYFEGCPHWSILAARIADVTAGSGVGMDHHVVRSEEDAMAWQMRGSPTVLVDGRDPFPSGDEPIGLACRVYQTPAGPAGSPTVEQLRDALTRRQRYGAT